MDSKNLQEKERENRQLVVNKQEVVNEMVQDTNHSIWEKQFKDSEQLTEEKRHYAEVEKNRNVWKYEKKRKKAAQSLHDAQGREELRKEKFLQPSVKMLNRVDEQLDSLKKGGVTELFELSACMDNCIKINEQEASLDLDKVITAEDYQSQDYKTLSDIFKELKQEDALLITSEKLDKLFEKYNSLNLKIQAPCSKYLKSETHENVSFKPGELLEPSSGYFIIYNCVLTALKNCVDQLDESYVNIEEFSKLCGLEASSSLAASAICNNAEFKTKRDDVIVYKLKQVKDKEEQERIEQENKAKLDAENKQKEEKARLDNLKATNIGILKVLIEKYSLTASWFKPMLMEYIEKYHENILYMEGGQGQDGVIFGFNKVLKNINKRISEIGNALDNHQELVQNMPQLKLYLAKKIVNAQAGSLGGKDEFTLTEEKIEELKKDAMVVQCANRKKQLLDAVAEIAYYSSEWQGELWANNDIQDMLMDEKDAFDVKIQRVKEQTEENINKIKLIIAERILPINEHMAYDNVMKHLGVNGLFCSPAILENNVNRYLTNKNIMSESLLLCEKRLRRAMKKLGLEKCQKEVTGYLEISGRYDINSTESDYIEILTGLKDTLLINRKNFDEKIADKLWTKEQWEEIYSWCSKHELEQGSEFKKKLDEELKSEKFQKPSHMGIQKDTYLYGEKGTEVKAKKEGYVEKLKGDILCKWADFKGAFDNDENTMLDSLKVLIENGGLQEQLPFITKVKSYEQIENLTYMEFCELVNALRGNIMMYLDMWSNLEGLNTQDLKYRVLPVMMQGKMSIKEIVQFIEEENQKLVKDYEHNDMLFYVLTHNRQQEMKDLDYSMLSGDSYKNQFMPEKRIKRFENAKVFWSWAERVRTLRSDLVTLFIAFKNKFSEQYSEPKYQKNIVNLYNKELKLFAKDLESYLEEVDTEKADYKKFKYGDLYNIIYDSRENLQSCINQVIDKNDNIISLSEYIKEAMLFGSEMNLLGYDGQGAGVFSAGSDQEYNKFLYDRNYVIAIRYKQVFQCLKGHNYSAEEMNQTMDKMRRIIVGMEPVTSIDAELTQEMKEKNRAEFGKASFDEVISSIEKTGELSNDDATKVQWEKATRLYDKRVDRLKYDDRFKLLVPYLLRETVFLRKIMTLDDVSFENYIDGLTKGNVGNLIKATKEQSEFFKKQFIMENIKEIIDENNIIDSGEWYRKYIEFDNALAEKKLGGRSIKERLDIVMSGKDSSWYWYLDHIFRENPTEIKALLHTKDLEALIKKYDKILNENKKSIEECETYKKLKKQNMAYADQFVTSRQKEMVTMPNDLFKSSVESWAQEFEYLINNVELKVDNSALILNARFCKEYEEKKQAGKALRSEQINQAEKWHEQMWKQCSPYLVVKNNTDALSNKTIKKAKKEIREQYWDYSDIVQNLLAERMLANPKADEVGIRMNAIFLERAWEKTEGSINNSPDGMTMQRAQQFMIFLDLHADERPNDEVEFTKIYDKLLEEFNKRQNLIDEFNIQLVFEKEGYGKLATQIKDVMSGLDNMGKYTMSDIEFESFIENERKYWMNVYTASQLLKKNLAYKEKSEDDLKGPIEFFLDYFSKEICDGTYIDVINSDNIVKLVKDTEFYKFVKNPESKIGRVSPLDYEKSSGIITHDDVIKLITDTKDEDVIQSYNALSLEERQIFALTLMISGRITENENLPTVEYIRGKAKNEEASDEEDTNDPIAEQIQNYVNHKEFVPQIEYAKVFANLKNEDNTLNKDVFEETLAFTNLCKMQYQQNQAKDWKRIKDGTSAIEVAKLGAPMGVQAHRALQENVSKIEGSNSFVQVIKEVIESDKERNKSLPCYERLMTLLQNGENIPMLIMMLQDRTILDNTTGVNFIDRANGIVHTHVNEEGRKMVSDVWVNIEDANQEMIIRANQQEFCQKAFISLLSYQLRDDISFLERGINKNDFAKGAYDRKTILDWTLIERAFELMDEIEIEMLRRKAVQQAPKNIENSGNEAATTQYRKYLAEFEVNRNGEKDHGDIFNSFLMENLEENCNDNKNPEVAVLMAGYKDLDENQRALFIQVLQRRDFLDVSKVGSTLSHFGLAERDYVNPEGRNELISDYILKTLSSKNKLIVNNEEYQNAVYSLLSTQIDDSVDFIAMRDKEKGISSAVEKKSFYRDSRKTAVDWKLFRRALQFVQRATNERDILIQNQELYLSQTDTGADKLFDMDAKFLRRNVHKSGNRASRFIGKRILKHFVDKFPVRLQRMALLVLPIETANQVNNIDAFQREEGKVSDIVSEIVTDANDAITSFIEGKVEDLDNEYIKSGILDTLEEYTEKAEDALIKASYEEEIRLAQKKGASIFEMEKISKEYREKIQKVQEEREKEKEKEKEEEKEEEKEQEGEKEEKEEKEQEGEKEEQKDEKDDESGGDDEDGEDDEEEGEEEEKYVNYKHELSALLKEKDGKELSVLDFTSVGVNEFGRQVKKFDNFVKTLNEGADNITQKINTGVEYANKGLEIIQEDTIQGYISIGTKLAADYKIISEENRDKIMSGVNKFTDKLHGSGLEDGVEKALEVADEVKEMIGDFQDCLKVATKVTKVVTGVVDTTKKVVGTLQQKEQLDDAKKESLEAREQDEEARIKAEEALTEEERKYVDLAIQRNRKANDISTDVVHSNLNDDIARTIIEYSTDIISTYANEATVGVNVKAIMTEATELIFFFRNLYKDNEMLKKYYDQNEKEARRIREKFVEMNSSVDYNILTKFSNMEIIQHAKGFENFTELAEYVGRNLVQALLFCASKFNPQLETRIQSVAVLKILGVEDAIGKQDSAVAERVFNKMFNQAYR